MKLRFIVWVLLVFFTAFCLLTAEMKLTQNDLAMKTVRLHVVANSDGEEDQRIKLCVRDEILEQVGKLTENCEDSREAREVLGAHLEELKDAAGRVLRSEGSEASVEISLGKEAFPTRYYETFTLPAGTYPALRVTIGAGQGHNWWCVVFPSLCTAATADMVEEYAQVGGFDEEEARLITGGEEEYELRFQAYEWLQRFLAWIS